MWEAEQGWRLKDVGDQIEMGPERVCGTQNLWEAQAEVEDIKMWDVQAEVDSQKVR